MNNLNNNILQNLLINKQTNTVNKVENRIKIKEINLYLNTIQLNNDRTENDVKQIY